MDDQKVEKANLCHNLESLWIHMYYLNDIGQEHVENDINKINEKKINKEMEENISYMG
jgi:hypothetical protein